LPSGKTKEKRRQKGGMSTEGEVSHCGGVGKEDSIRKPLSIPREKQEGSSGNYGEEVILKDCASP